ncbi:hypothetical protein A9Q76_03745 [Arcobacter sp. 31_11_sub10_T18]|nr:hypothetical protein A9Q76_03745 [Arcobacter sp. 31_11_sub10_T18]
MIKLFNEGIRRQIIAPMIVTMICAMIIIYSFLIYKNESNIIDSSVVFAKNNIEQYLTIRKYYTSNVINKILKYSDLEVNISLNDNPKAIPLPATMIHDLSDLLREKRSKIKLNLYSNYPFPNRENRVLDKFERESLLFLEKNPKGTFYKREMYESKDSVRVVIADVLSDNTCVSCHNSLANTPKNDWNLYDVRGALEIIVPIDEIVENNFNNTIQTVVLLFCILFISIFIIYLTINNKLLNSIERISTFVNNIKDGNLNDTVVIKQDNELQALSNNVNSMRISLKNTLNLLNEENKIRKKAEEDLFSLNEKLEDTIYNRTIELKKQNKELKTTVKRLENTQDDLTKSEKMANLGELVGGITHEINTPLGISITTASFIQNLTSDLEKIYNNEDMSEDEFESFIKSIKENIINILSSLNRVSITLNSFRDIALDQVIEEKRIFNIRTYLDEVLIALRHKTKKHKHEIIVDIDKTINIDSYPGYFYQIFTNLINNSYLHAFEGINEGKIFINMKKFDGHLELTYSDNGSGIQKEEIQEIFKAYYTTKRGSGGTGLGLGIVNDLITNKLNGSIKIDKEHTVGLRYIIIIPLEQ